MSRAFAIVLFVHICAGVAGLVAFWLPAVARKGGTLHVRAGRTFFWCTSVVAATGLAMAALILAAPLDVRSPQRTVSAEQASVMAAQIRSAVPFLAYLVLITFVPVYHGVRVLETRRAPEQLRTRFHVWLHVLSIAGSAAMVVLGVWLRQPVFLALSPIGVLIGKGGLAFARNPRQTPMAWWYEHMNSMLGGGIAFHTAFLVLGAGRLLNVQLEGAWAAVPWVLPAIVGIPASAVWVRYYRRKFKETPAVRGRVAAARVP